MIPPEQINPAALRYLLDYLREDIFRALGERRPLEEKWLKYQKLYKAQPESPVRMFPFQGAANVVLPVAATDVDTIYSRLAGILFGPENLWSCTALREDMIDYAPRLQEFLKWAQRAELKAYEAVADWLLELCKLGTGVLKERYRRESKLVYEFRETPQGTLARHQRLNVLDNPRIDHVSLFNFLVPAGTTDHQEASWNAERLMLSNEQVAARVRAGIYLPDAAQRLLVSRGHDRPSWLEDEAQRAQGFQAGITRKHEVWEVWTDFDLGQGPQALVCTIHLPSMTYLRYDYNPFFHQEKPYDVGRYLRQEKQFYGMGLCEMQEMFQEEATTMHRQRLDNNTLNNAPMMWARSGSGIREDEPVVPGRWFITQEPEDIKAIAFGRLANSTVQDEQMLMQYSARRTGVNDYVMGNQAASIGYATAQTNIMQHQEAAKRFDQTLREARVALSGAGRRSVELYQQFNTSGKEFYVLGQRDGEMVRQILQFPLELIRHSVAIDVTATSAALNKDVQVRTNTILMQLVTQFYQQMYQMMTLVVNPQMPPLLRMLAERMIVGSNTMMRRVLDSYDMQDVDRIIPDIQEILAQQQMMMGGMGFPAAQPLPGMALPQQMAGAPAPMLPPMAA